MNYLILPISPIKWKSLSFVLCIVNYGSTWPTVGPVKTLLNENMKDLISLSS